MEVNIECGTLSLILFPHTVLYTIIQWGVTTGSFTASGLRNEAVNGLFLDFWGPQRLLWSPKVGRKLNLGKKHTSLGLMVSPDGGQKKDNLQDLVNWAWYTGYL